jgi:hypothetical protein
MLSAAAALDGKELHTEPLRRDVAPDDISAMGYQAAAAGDFDRAVLIFRRLLMRAPEDGPLWAAFADASAKAGRPIESLFAWREALRSGPDVARSRERSELCVDITERLPGEPPAPTLDAVTLLTEAKKVRSAGLRGRRRQDPRLLVCRDGGSRAMEHASTWGNRGPGAPPLRARDVDGHAVGAQGAGGAFVSPGRP